MTEQWYQYPVSHGYITQYEGQGTDTPHYALDLATPIDTPLYFPDSGTIVQEDFAVWNGKAGGGEIFLLPDDPLNHPYEEYFYHLDNFAPNVKVGTHVNAGDVVGFSGGQNSGGSHPTDTMWSSAPHTHFGEFQKYVSTPDGNRPYGPDPSGLIAQMEANNIVSGAIPAGASTVANVVSSPFTAIDNVIQWFQQGGLQRVGLVVLGGAIMIGGIVVVSKQ